MARVRIQSLQPPSPRPSPPGEGEQGDAPGRFHHGWCWGDSALWRIVLQSESIWAMHGALMPRQSGLFHREGAKRGGCSAKPSEFDDENEPLSKETNSRAARLPGS